MFSACCEESNQTSAALTPQEWIHSVVAHAYNFLVVSQHLWLPVYPHTFLEQSCCRTGLEKRPKFCNFMRGDLPCRQEKKNLPKSKLMQNLGLILTSPPLLIAVPMLPICLMAQREFKHNSCEKIVSCRLSAVQTSSPWLRAVLLSLLQYHRWRLWG